MSLILGRKSADARHKVGQDEVPPTEPASVLDDCNRDTMPKA
jgi:hypothetical protein